MHGVVIRDAVGGSDVAVARALFDEYAKGLGVDLCFQHFAAELEGLPGGYAPPRGCLLLAWRGAAAAGCVALRPLEEDASVGEIKRLYLRPSARGCGAGRALAEAVIARARAIGYRELKLDTLATMEPARALYASLGFRACEPYYANPLPGVAYLSIPLVAGAA